MTLVELYSIEREYEASGHHYLIGRTAPGNDLKRFIVLSDPFPPRAAWHIAEKPFGAYQAVPLSRSQAAGRYYLQYLHQLLSSSEQKLSEKNS